MNAILEYLLENHGEFDFTFDPNLAAFQLKFVDQKGSCWHVQYWATERFIDANFDEFIILLEQYIYRFKDATSQVLDW